MIYRNISEIVSFEKWNRKILNAFWLIVLITFITEIVIFILVVVKRGDANSGYFGTYILNPLLFNVTLFSIIELLHWLIKDKFKEITKYMIVLAGTLLVCNLVYVHHSVALIYVLFVFQLCFLFIMEIQKLRFFR